MSVHPDPTPVPPWPGRRVTVVGLGTAGFACADALCDLGAIVTVLDARTDDTAQQRAEVLRTIGATVLLGQADELPAQQELLVVSPGVRPHAPIIRAAQQQQVPVWGELELAWQLRPQDNPAPWLCITGTNGKTTTTMMVAAMCAAAGLRSIAAGNIGTSLVDVVRHEDVDVIAVEVGAPQLPFVHSMSPHAAVCLNVAPDHLDHFGDFAAYCDAKRRIYERVQVACIYDEQEPLTRTFVEQADVCEGARAIGITNAVPDISMLGVVEDLLVDRAFLSQRRTQALELAAVADVHPPVPHQVTNALAAAALARSINVPPAAISAGLRSFQPAPHRLALVLEDSNQVRWVNDSKATNVHAAQTALRSYDSIVWIGGGDGKGQDFTELVREHGAALRAAVLLGASGPELAELFQRYAPEVPVELIAEQDPTQAQHLVVRAAATHAQPGDTVLLAPACASWDMYPSYEVRGDLFTAAVRSQREEA